MLVCRTLAILFLVAGIVAVSARSSQAQDIDYKRVAAVKAAYLLNFVKYTHWPSSAFQDDRSPIVITLVGTCDVTDVLARAVRESQPIHSRRLSLRTATMPQPDATGRVPDEQMERFLQSLRESHLVHFCSHEMSAVRPILDRLRGEPVLTVSDIPRFAQNGGMLDFILEGSRIVFEANPKEIQNGNLTVSAKVLKLARIVETR